MALDERTEQLIQAGLHDLLLMRLVREVKVQQPAAGANWTQAVPGGVVWELLTVEAQFVTSAVVANRTHVLAVKDADALDIARLPSGITNTATTNNTQLWAPGYGTQLGIQTSGMPLPTPPLILLPSWTIGSSVGSIDAGDQFSNVILTVRVWSESQIVLNAKQIGLAVQSLTIDK